MSSIGLGPFDLLRDATAQLLVAPDPEVPVTILTIPSQWALIMPCGCVDGLMRGSAHHATAEAVMVTFFPNSRTRTAKLDRGWFVRPASASDIEEGRKPPSHEGHA